MHPADPTDRRFAPHRTGDATPLGQLESAVMEVVWRGAAPASVSDVHAALPSRPAVAYTTVKTTLERLAVKGILRRARAGKAYFYAPAVSRDELERRIVSRALDRLVEQFPRAVASFFVRPEPGLSEDQLALLEQAIERRRREDE